ncbi:MAG: inorganic phosphate transporter, partial [Acidobacteriota bacterium]
MASPVTDASVLAGASQPSSILDEKLSRSSSGRWGAAAFIVMLLAGLIYIGSKLSSDLSVVHSPSVFPFILL